MKSIILSVLAIVLTMLLSIAPGTGAAPPVTESHCIRLGDMNGVFLMLTNCDSINLNINSSQPAGVNSAGNPVPPFSSTQITAPGEENRMNGGWFGVPEKWWACSVPKVPIDTNTNQQPTYQSTNVVCK